VPPALPAPDAVARAVVDAITTLADTQPAGWSAGPSGAPTIVTGIEIPSLNGVWVLEPDVSPATIEAALDELHGTGLPRCVQARPACRAATARIAQAWDLTPIVETIPLMAVAEPLHAPSVGGLSFRRLAEHELDVHTMLASQAFGVAPELFDRVAIPGVSLAGAHVYVGEIAGEPVTTSMQLLRGEGAAVFNIATPPAHRGQGYAAAITAHTVNEGFAAGARYGWLQSTEEGFGVYDRLGFATLERWTCWIAD
jgi:GNAT superfamily N-acetyltransferase